MTPPTPTQKTERAPFLILGVGNELFRDEGLGIVAARLTAPHAGDDVEVVDGGTLGLGLVPALEDREGVVVLDAAVADGHGPGARLELDPGDLSSGGVRLLSAHQIGLAEALAVAALGGRAPRRVVLLALVPEDLTTGVGPTPDIEALLPALAERALELVAAWRAECGQEAVHA